jgi:TatD DNase family protein
MLNIIETHAHIYDEVYADNLELMLQNAKMAGVSEIWMPNCDSTTLKPMLDLAVSYPDFCLPMVGLHPCYVKEGFEIELQIIESELKRNRPLAIGEIGIDLFWDKTFFEQQKEAFLFQCNLALEHNLWIDIHSRNAFWETAELIEKIDNHSLKGIFHCFSGTLDEAQKAIDLGFLLGIGGVSTFKNGGLDKVLPFIGLENIVLETDSPYLAPVPYRGKRNEPAYLPLIAQKVADFYEMDVAAVCKATSQNAMKLKESFTNFNVNI